MERGNLQIQEWYCKSIGMELLKGMVHRDVVHQAPQLEMWLSQIRFLAGPALPGYQVLHRQVAGGKHNFFSSFGISAAKAATR